jgi:thiamine biosynthesis lipoprotein
MFDRLGGAVRRAIDAVLERAQTAAQGGWLSREEAIMGTSVRVELWSEDRAAGEAAIAAVMDRMHQIDETMSHFKPESELMRINRTASDAPVPISRPMYDIIARSTSRPRASGTCTTTAAGSTRTTTIWSGVVPRSAIAS